MNTDNLRVPNMDDPSTPWSFAPDSLVYSVRCRVNNIQRVVFWRPVDRVADLSSTEKRHIDLDTQSCWDVQKSHSSTTRQ